VVRWRAAASSAETATKSGGQSRGISGSAVPRAVDSAAHTSQRRSRSSGSSRAVARLLETSACAVTSWAARAANRFAWWTTVLSLTVLPPPPPPPGQVGALRASSARKRNPPTPGAVCARASASSNWPIATKARS
jgi:hypothetical protein